MIRVECDHCGSTVPPGTPGGCRLLLGRDEWAFQLCADCQRDALLAIRNMLLAGRLVAARGSKLQQGIRL